MRGRRYRGIRINIPYCSFIISLPILKPRPITLGLGNAPSIARYFKELKNKAEDEKV